VTVEDKFSAFVNSLTADEQREAQRLMIEFIRAAIDAPPPDDAGTTWETTRCTARSEAARAERWHAGQEIAANGSQVVRSFFRS
jgi:hypothetical protein